MLFSSFYDVNIKERIHPKHLFFPMLHGDALANRIGVRLFDGEKPFIPAGDRVVFIYRSDGQEIRINCETNGNEMWVDLPADAYAVVGPIDIHFSIVNGDTKTTVFLCSARIRPGETDKTIEPNSRV